jgi:hypothetical protein
MLVFIHTSLFINYLALFILSFLISTKLSTKHKFILFFCAGAILKPPLKAVTRAGEAEALLLAFGLSVGFPKIGTGCVGLQMCLRLWVGF